MEEYNQSDTDSTDTDPTAETNIFMLMGPEPMDDDSNYFEYDYTPPSNSTMRKFDSTRQLGSQLADFSSDSLNTRTMAPRGDKSEYAFSMSTDSRIPSLNSYSTT